MKNKLIFTNEIPKKFIEHQEYIKEIIKSYFNAFDLDCELKIKFVDSVSTNEYEVTDCVMKNKSINKHELTITNSALNSINYDGGKFFCLSIYHEFEHIRDYNNMMKTNLFNFNLCLMNQKNYENTYISKGFLFWTEIYAYYQTLDIAKKYKFDFEKITFGNLVEKYIKTITQNAKLYYKPDISYDDAVKYIDHVDSFVYLCSKYMAAVFAKHSRVPHSKINKNKNYKKVYTILCGLEPKINRLINNPYCSKSYDNLLRLGKYLCENIRWKIFKVGLTEKNRKIASFY